MSQATPPEASSIRNGSASGLLIRTVPAPKANRPDSDWIAPSGASRDFEPERDRPFGEQRRRLLGEGLEVGEADVAGFERQRRPVADPGARRDRPAPRRSGRGDSGFALLAGAVEDEVEVPIGHRASERFVVDFEAGVGERQPVEVVTGARHRIRAGPDQGCDIEALEARILARQGDRSGGIAPRGGDRQRSVGRHPEPETEFVEFEPAHLDVADQGGERREADLAARRREHRAALPVDEPQFAEAQSDAPGIVHDIGRTELDHIVMADPLLQTRGDPVVQPREIDRAARQPESQERNGRERDEPHGLGEVD